MDLINHIQPFRLAVSSGLNTATVKDNCVIANHHDETYYSMEDRGRLSFGVGCQKAYDSINICQKIFFFIL